MVGTCEFDNVSKFALAGRTMVIISDIWTTAIEVTSDASVVDNKT